ncbi:cell division cycle 5-related protein-like [Dysidea avara]|uniref:cell division cycle 5-related protein-like n=1 Tax=Dysidea avara TaxID=196820 RepID=UPI003316D697
MVRSHWTHTALYGRSATSKYCSSLVLTSTQEPPWPVIIYNKDQLESLEKKLQDNRSLMTKEAKKAAKLEKKLKILTGGYQSRAASLNKQISDVHEQVEQCFVELNTFEGLRSQELQAIPRRIQQLKEEVQRQMDRQNRLQMKYANLSMDKQHLYIQGHIA